MWERFARSNYQDNKYQDKDTTFGILANYLKKFFWHPKLFSLIDEIFVDIACLFSKWLIFNFVFLANKWVECYGNVCTKWAEGINKILN